MNTDYLVRCEEYLTAAPVEDRFRPLVSSGGGHQNCFGVTLVGGVTCYVKPDDGTQPSRTAVSNEVAAWETVKLLEWPHLMAPTVLRTDIVSPITNTATTSSLQVFWAYAQPAPLVASLSTLEVEQAGTFDYLIAHSDRPENSNYLGVTLPTSTSGGQVRLKLIDHGFAFDYPNRLPNSVFVNSVRGRELDQATVAAVEQLISSAESSPLPALLSPDAYANLMARAESLVSLRQIN